MTDDGDVQSGDGGACGELRRRVDTACAEVSELRASALAAAETLTRTKASLAEAEARLISAQHTADPRVIADAKAQARRVYRRDYDAAEDDNERQRAATAWMRQVDRLNRDARAAGSALADTRQEISQLDAAVTAATRIADAARIRAETAADACHTAREQLAACEEREIRAPITRPLVEAAGSASPLDRPDTAARAPAVPWPEPSTAPWESEVESEAGAAAAAASGAAPEGASGAGAGNVRYEDVIEPPRPPTTPLVIHRLVEGDREVLRRVSSELAEATGQEPTTLVLLLQELVDALASVAAADGFLDFGQGHAFWGQFSPEEIHTIVGALAGVGCRYDARHGFQGSRMPGWSDFSLAMAHAGYDLRGVRGVPRHAGFGELFRGARVAIDEQLALRAPQLTLDQVTNLIGPAGDGLGDLWDNWGRLRPILLAASDERGRRPA